MRNPTKTLHRHAKRFNQVTVDRHSGNQRLRGCLPTGSKKLLGKRQQNCFVGKPLRLVLDRGWSRVTVVGDLSLSWTCCDRGVAECIWAKGGFKGGVN
jgi:hypothetical protein